jgi:hypothetical protein
MYSLLDGFEGKWIITLKGKDMNRKENADNEVMYRKDNGCPLNPTQPRLRKEI